MVYKGTHSDSATLKQLLKSTVTISTLKTLFSGFEGMQLQNELCLKNKSVLSSIALWKQDIQEKSLTQQSGEAL